MMRNRDALSAAVTVRGTCGGVVIIERRAALAGGNDDAVDRRGARLRRIKDAAALVVPRSIVWSVAEVAPVSPSGSSSWTIISPLFPATSASIGLVITALVAAPAGLTVSCWSAVESEGCVGSGDRGCTDNGVAVIKGHALGIRRNHDAGDRRGFGPAGVKAAEGALVVLRLTVWAVVLVVGFPYSSSSVTVTCPPLPTIKAQGGARDRHLVSQCWTHHLRLRRGRSKTGVGGSQGRVARHRIFVIER